MDERTTHTADGVEIIYPDDLPRDLEPGTYALAWPAPQDGRDLASVYVEHGITVTHIGTVP